MLERMLGLTPVAAWIEGLHGVIDHAPAAGGRRGGQGGHPLGRGRRSRQQLGCEGEGEPAGRVGHQGAVGAGRWCARRVAAKSNAPASTSGRKLCS